MRYFLIILGCALAINVSNASNEDIDKAMPTFRTFLSKQATANKQGHNVHAFNRSFKAHSNLIRLSNKKLELTSESSAVDILVQFGVWRKEYNLSPDFDTNIAKLRAYIEQGKDLDDETSLCAHELLRAISCYINRLDKIGQTIALSEFFYYLAQNSTEKGGCYAGYVGRLALINAKIIVELG